MGTHTPGPWAMSRPMGTEHLRGAEPWFWVSADRTLHLRVAACADGYVVGENEANARLIAAAPDGYDAAILTIEHMEWSTEQGRAAYEALRAFVAKARAEA